MGASVKREPTHIQAQMKELKIICAFDELAQTITTR